MNPIARLFPRESTASLASRLSLWFSGLSIVLTLVLVAVVDVSATAALQDQIGQKLAELAYQTTDKLDHGMYERYREVAMLASRPELGSPALSDTARQALLDQLQASYPSYAWIGLTDLNGKVLAATKGVLKGADVSRRPWFSNALNGIHVGDVHEAKLLASKLPNPSGEPWRFIDLAFPYRNRNGEIAGVLGVHMSWEWTRDIERSVFEPAQRRSKVEAMIVSAGGDVLLGPPSLIEKTVALPSLAEAQANNNHYRVERWSDQKTYLVGYSRSAGHSAFPGLGWSVLVRQDVTQAFAPVKEIQERMFWSGFAIALLFALFGVLNARRITQPLVALAVSASKVRTGGADGLVVLPGRYREVRELGDALTRLVDDLRSNEAQLRELNASLERRVEERTAALAASEVRLRMIANSMPALIGYIDSNERCRFANDTYMDWFSKPPEEIEGCRVRAIVGETWYRNAAPYIRRALSGKRVTFESSRRFRGNLQYLKTTYIPDRDPHGKVSGFYVMSQDITELKTTQIALEHDVLHDSLTGLPNRYALMNQLESAIERAKRSRVPLAVLFLDLDKFKLVNDTYGHQAGDELLKEFARRLQACVRQSDTVARLAGDEFVILAEHLVNGANDAFLVANKVLAGVEQPVEYGAMVRQIATSIGIALYTPEMKNAEQMLLCADKAMYEAKRSGRNRIVRYTEAIGGEELPGPEQATLPA